MLPFLKSFTQRRLNNVTFDSNTLQTNSIQCPAKQYAKSIVTFANMSAIPQNV